VKVRYKWGDQAILNNNMRMFNIVIEDLSSAKIILYIFAVKLLTARNRPMLRRIAISREEKSKVCYGKMNFIFIRNSFNFRINVTD